MVTDHGQSASVALRSGTLTHIFIYTLCILQSVNSMSDNEIMIERLLPLKPAVLLILLTLGEEHQHGYGIMSAVRERSGGLIDLGTSHLYRHLKRLLDSGMVEETAHNDGGDPRRRYYRLTDFGGQVLAAEAARLDGVVAQTRAIGLYSGRPS